MSVERIIYVVKEMTGVLSGRKDDLILGEQIACFNMNKLLNNISIESFLEKNNNFIYSNSEDDPDEMIDRFEQIDVEILIDLLRNPFLFEKPSNIFILGLAAFLELTTKNYKGYYPLKVLVYTK